MNIALDFDESRKILLQNVCYSRFSGLHSANNMKWIKQGLKSLSKTFLATHRKFPTIADSFTKTLPGFLENVYILNGSNHK